MNAHALFRFCNNSEGRDQHYTHSIASAMVFIDPLQRLELSLMHVGESMRLMPHGEYRTVERVA